MRIRMGEITPTRLYEAVARRVGDIPDALAWRQSALASRNRELLEHYRNIHREKRCVIMANGPSLAGMDLSCLQNVHTFSMNRAYLLYEQWGFTPSYFVCINELVIDQFAEDIAKLSLPKFLNYNRRQLFADTGNDDSQMYLRLGLNLNDRFSGEVTSAISSGGTVTFACLQLAYFMGFGEVLLIGLDHNFIEKGVPNTTEVRSSEKDESHCHPDYFPKGIKWQLPDLYRSELAYALARQAFEADGRKVLDATVGGKCDVFPKVNFRDQF